MSRENDACPMCFDVGWVLDVNDLGKAGGRCVEFIKCFYPTCEAWPAGPSGRPLNSIVFKGVKFRSVTQHPSESWVMRLGAPVKD